METFAIHCRQTVTPTQFASFMESKGAYVIAGVAPHYCWKRGEAAVYVSLETAGESDPDSLERVQKKLSWQPQSTIVVTVSREQGSVFLAFELAAAIADRWTALVDLDGLEQWEQWFSDSQRARRGRPS